VVFEFFRGGPDRRLVEITGRISQMLLDCRHTFELAYDALLDGGDPMAVGPEVRSVDIGVNKAERQVRRELLVHVSVRGAKANLPVVLASMSVAKDAERIGDYAKNIWDLAAAGIDFSEAPDRDALVAWRDRVAQAISDVAATFVDRDTQAAHSLIVEFDEVADEFDALITAQIASAGSPRDAVPRALLYRYLKRVVAHLMNILTSLVMPIDRLDFYDEKKADRE
jgi:phosphate uptake regulator